MARWRRVLGRLDRWTTWGGSGLADEACAFLRGDLLERMRETGSGGRTPPWLWLNGVAHGDLEHVRALAAGCRAGGGQTASGWRGARAVLAQELMTRSGGDPAVLRALQDRALVPLELALPDLPDLTPGRLVDIGVQEMRLTEV